ncbi:MAG: NDP-sugar synthase [Euryarchaeota archaeon]|nr:NDP-sugar synthase [Euryarchaeota archaeon]MDE1835790.1 NDP-sugar synthase [Euryarchaeota archaeon]MDE1880736.1 NDP-sugar synthase [Euryarchaeota archaeon]MDE2043981.1 NDP-sugar synthase [Thermoplasmata archaeon]
MPEVSAVVLVGGFGTRLRPVTYAVPKQLIPLAGQPTLFHAMDMLPSAVSRISLACGYKADAFEAYLQRHPYRLPVRVVREATPLGTGGGLKNGADGATDPFVLVNGDVICGLDMDPMLEFHREHGGMGTMSFFEVEDPSPYGVAVWDDDRRITKFVEKPPKESAPSRWINAGASIWSTSVLDHIPGGREVSLEREVLPKLLDRGVYGFAFRGWWEDAGTPARLLHAQRLLFDHPRTGRFAPKSHLPGARVVPPVASGRDSEAQGATVGRYVTLGDRVRIGPGATVEDSILMDGAEVGQGATVRRCVLGPGYHVAPRSDLADQCLANEGPSA